jgi:hypothetical protein
MGIGNFFQATSLPLALCNGKHIAFSKLLPNLSQYPLQETLLGKGKQQKKNRENGAANSQRKIRLGQ